MHTCNFLGSKKTTAVSQKNSLVPWNCEFCYSCVFAALRWFGNNSVPTLQETTGCLMGERCEYCARASRLNVANTLEKLDLRFVSYCRLASLHLKIIWSIQMPSYACPIETACFVLFFSRRNSDFCQRNCEVSRVCLKHLFFLLQLSINIILQY
jgi:hypothetical protein